MAGNLPVPQGVEVKLVWARSGIPFALNILHFRHAVGTLHSQTRANAISTAYATAFTSSGLGGQFHTTVSLLRTESRHMDSNTDPWFIGNAAAVAGTGTGDLMPLYTAYCVTQRTGLRGRSYNGRVYLAGWTEAANDASGQVAAAASLAGDTFVGNAYSDLVTNLQLTGAVLSRWTTPPGSPPNTPPTERNPPILTDITNITHLDLRWDVQRRRIVPGI